METQKSFNTLPPLWFRAIGTCWQNQWVAIKLHLEEHGISTHCGCSHILEQLQGHLIGHIIIFRHRIWILELYNCVVLFPPQNLQGVSILLFPLQLVLQWIQLAVVPPQCPDRHTRPKQNASSRHWTCLPKNAVNLLLCLISYNNLVIQ